MRAFRPGHEQGVASVFLFFLGVAGFALGADATVALPSPVSYQRIVRREPNFSLHVVTIDLKDPRVSVHVARGGSDPDGDGPWVTTLMSPSDIAEREQFDITINGDFFAAQATPDTEGKNTGYILGKPAAPIGPAMTEGELWYRGAGTRPYLVVTSGSVAKLGQNRALDPIDPNAREVISGSQIIVREGQAVTYTTKFALDRHPRTVVGVSQAGKQLVFLVVDGRQPSLSIGMTLAELSSEMIRLGCENALNLDGGGSTTLVYRDPATKKLRVLNSPSDTIERSVADVLGVKVRAPLPAPN